MIDKIKNVLGLSLSLSKANFRVRNEGSYLGVLWYLLDPLLLFLILLAIFSGRLGIENYPIYLLVGLVMYNLFSGVTSQSVDVIANSAGFIKSTKIRYEPLVISNLLQFIYTHIIEIVVLAAFMVYYGMPLNFLIFYPFLLVVYCVFILGFSFVLATIGVYVNDMRNVWVVVVRLIWFATPIFYTLDKASLLFMLNPLAHFISVGRDLIIAQQVPSILTILSLLLLSVVSLIIGLLVFSSFKKNFAERV